MSRADAEEEHAVAFVLRVAEEDPRPALFDAVVGRGLMILRLGRRRVSLEEIFRRLTTTEAD